MDTKQYQLFVVLKYVFLLHFLKENKWDTQKKKRKLILLQSQSSNYTKKSFKFQVNFKIQFYNSIKIHLEFSELKRILCTWAVQVNFQFS